MLPVFFHTGTGPSTLDLRVWYICAIYCTKHLPVPRQCIALESTLSLALYSVPGPRPDLDRPWKTIIPEHLGVCWIGERTVHTQECLGVKRYNKFESWPSMG